MKINTFLLAIVILKLHLFSSLALCGDSFHSVNTEEQLSTPIAAQESRSETENNVITSGQPSFHDQTQQILGCSHYKRACKLIAACCGKAYTCRRCHDDTENHTIDRHATQLIECMKCTKIQPVAEKCSECSTLFASYFCNVCNFFDDSKELDKYHCDKCGVCRVGKASENEHCNKCNACIPKDTIKSHPCIENATDSSCPICLEDLKSTTIQVIFMRCGHPMHHTCFQDYTKHNYTCPTCKKSLTDMSRYWESLNNYIQREKEQQPELFRDKPAIQILCNDCHETSGAEWHYQSLKCTKCGGYNTQKS